MKAILTKYIGPTDFRGARIKAWDMDGNSVTVSYPYEMNQEERHRFAANALRLKMKWHADIVGGAIKGGYAFVFVK